MTENSAIEWTDHTFNAWIGCTKISPGCDHCYAERTARRFGTTWGARAERRVMSDAYWREPLRWNARAAKSGKRERVFCSSMADVFDNEAPEGQRERLWSLIRATPHLIWLLLTKRIGSARAMLPSDWGPIGFDNVAIGATIVNQDETDRDLPKLLALSARWRFLSIEPMLGPIDLGDWDHECGDPPHGRCPVMWPDWVICGGESGPDARPMHPAWARALRDQCAAAGARFFFKQWGEWLPALQDGQHVGDDFSDRDRSALWDGTRWDIGVDPFDGNDDPENWSCRVGKARAGRLLDGREHNEIPEAFHA